MLHKNYPIVAEFFKTSLQKVFHSCPDWKAFMFCVNCYFFCSIILWTINNLLAFLFRYQLRAFSDFLEIYGVIPDFFSFKTWKIFRIFFSVIFEEREWSHKIISKFQQIAGVYLEISLMELFLLNANYFRKKLHCRCSTGL